MRSDKKIILNQLDRKLDSFYPCRDIAVPKNGWINALRTSLNMTLAQLGKKLGITKQGAKAIEYSESNGSITLNSLKDVANAMDLKLVYALVPREGSLDDLIMAKAMILARKIVMRTNHNMVLEDQGIESERLEKHIEDLADDFKRTLSKSLWE